MSDFSGPCLTMSMIFSVTFAFTMSVRYYYVLLQPMRTLMTAREYSGVYPQLPAVAFPDAAYVKFAGQVVLDKARAVSYNTLDSGAVTFCVAPITTSANAGRVEFWAYGVDCCGDTGGKFECDDAADADAKAGWVLQNTHDELWSNFGLYISPPDTRRDVYVQAVKKAEAQLKLSSPGVDAVFVRWTKKEKKDLVKLEWTLLILAAVILMICLAALSFCMTRLHQRFSFVRTQHRKLHKRGHHDDMDNTEEEDFTQRMDEFLADALEGAEGSDVRGTLDRMANFDPSKFRQNLSLTDTLIMNVLLPYLVAMLCVLLLSYANCYSFKMLIIVPFYCLLTIFIFAWLTTPHRTVTGIFILMVALNGSYVGHVNYRENMYHYCSVGERRSYEEVLADASTAEYGDAGKLEFEASAKLRTDLSVGFLYQDVTYCVAPVISDNAPCAEYSSSGLENATADEAAQSLLQDKHAVHHLGQRRSRILESKHSHHKRHTHVMLHSSLHEGEPVNFLQQDSHRDSRRVALKDAKEHCARPAPEKIEWWAIGKDCCDAQGKFWCDGGDVAGARAAVIVRPFPNEVFSETEEQLEDLADQGGDSYLDDREHFHQAINKSVAKFSLPQPERTVFLRWGTNVDDLRDDWQKKAASVVIVWGIVAFVVILLIGLMSHLYVRYIRRKEKESFEMYAQHHQAMNPAVPGSSVYNASDSRPSLAPLRSTEDAENRFSWSRRSADEDRF